LDRGAWEDWDFDLDRDQTPVVCRIPGSDRLRRDGCGEFVGCDSLRDEITLNPDLKLRERTSGGEIAHEGFAEWASLYGSGDLEQRGFRQMWNWQRDSRRSGVGVRDQCGEERQDQHADEQW
jgi:hypothetical protein